MSDLFETLRNLFSPAKRKRYEPFLDLLEAFRERTADWPGVIPTSGERVGILVTPWLSTAVPFFALECAEMVRRAGRIPALLFDATDLIQNSSDATHSEALARLLAERFRTFEVGDIENAVPQSGSADTALAEPIFRENSIWRSRGEVRADDYMAENAAALAKIAAHIARVRGLLAAARVERLLIPGGIFGLSGLYVALARETGLSFATFDGSAGVVRLTQQGSAAHLADVPGAFRSLRERLSPAERDTVLAMGRAELDDRFNARDFRHFQVTPATGRDDLRYDIFVPLNIRWDSAALGRQRAFPSVAEWLDAVLTWVATKPGVSICIRQHPRERLDFAKGSDNLGPLLERHATLGERLRFVAADEPLNSYDFLRHARVVLPHTSTVGIEAALLGLPVILGTAVYYEDLGFCDKASTRDEYFALLDSALAGGKKPSLEQRDNAALAYYLTQRCAFMQTVFTAHPDDFQTWVKLPHEDLWDLPETADFRSAFLSGEPLSLVRHHRLSNAR